MKSISLKQSLFTTGLVAIFIFALALVDYLVQLSRSEGVVAPGTEAQIGGEFSLLDQSGKPVTNDDFSDKYKLIFFGFTHCPDVCPTTLSKMSKMLDNLGSVADQLYPIFITVDPERDSPERLREYSSAFNSNIIYLTGSGEEIAMVLEAWQATRAKVALAGTVADSTQTAYTMNHSSVLYLMRPDNSLASSYNWEISIEDMTASIKRWLER